jgi:hypothetical protein
MDKAYAFPMQYVDRKLLKQVNQHKKIKKIASQMVFEQTWCRQILKHTIRPWGWDTMLGSHILDNRSKICSIKFQAYVRYGVLDYSSHLEKFLKSDKKKGGNAFNTIDEAPLDELLLYCGIDSLLEYWCAMDQMEEIK